MKFLFYSIILLLALSGCGDSDNNSTPEITTPEITNTDYNLHGKWIYVNSGESFSIYSNSLLSYEKTDDNLIKVSQNDNSYLYAMRAGTSKAKAVGNVQELTNASNSPSRSAKRDYSHIGGINVILENLNDSNTKSVVVTDDNGNFETDELPAGDYKVTIEDIEQSITITEETEELGTYTIVGEEVNNFKVGLELDEEFIYADNKQYTGKIIVENVSDATSVGVSYDIKISDPSLKYFNKTIVLGSILGHAKKEIPITFRFSAITESVKNVPIEVTIKDINGLTWTEALNIKLYKEKFYINIQANTANAKGYIILPFADKVVKINTKSTSITLPKVAEDYKVLLSNPSITTETTYSIGVQRSAVLTTSFNDPSNSEPNNNLESAKTINSGEIVESYMHVGDLDYWVIHVNENYETSNHTSYTQITSNGTYSPNGNYYYMNVTEDSYFNITGSYYNSSSNYLSPRFYDMSLKSLGTKINNVKISAGEYLIQSSSDFTIESFLFDNTKIFPTINTNGTYSPNGSYYYLNVTEDSNFNITGSYYNSSSNYLSPRFYNMNLKSLGTKINNVKISTGEYLIQSSSDFTIESNYFN